MSTQSRTQEKYSKTYPLKETPADTLVVYCSDHRFQAATRSFLDEELGLDGNYYAVSFPGSVQILTFEKALPKFANSLLRPIRFLIKNGGVKRIVAIAHEDCVWCKTFVPLYRASRKQEEVISEQRKDLVSARRILLAHHPQLTVELFFANISPEETVTFTKI